ncbi:MAG: nucleotidyltransferase domain-containing protein [Balneolales bacterium]|nr:nucleotidyltransferase domain-containing protein [Balneolales bacterium]
MERSRCNVNVKTLLCFRRNQLYLFDIIKLFSSNIFFKAIGGSKLKKPLSILKLLLKSEGFQFIMSIQSMLLFGSCARGDYKKKSDVDLLAIVDGDDYSLKDYEKANIVFYGKELFLRKLKEGDLFGLHIVKESAIVYDSIDIRNTIFPQFEYKTTYQREIQEASDLAYVLLKFCDYFSDMYFYNRKIAWCVRTILIAKSAEDRSPVFSAADLSNKFEDRKIKHLINNKNSEELHPETNINLRNILAQHGKAEPAWINDVEDFIECRSYFSAGSYPRKVVQGIGIDY